MAPEGKKKPFDYVLNYLKYTLHFLTLYNEASQ